MLRAALFQRGMPSKAAPGEDTVRSHGPRFAVAETRTTSLVDASLPAHALVAAGNDAPRSRCAVLRQARWRIWCHDGLEQSCGLLAPVQMHQNGLGRVLVVQE